MTEGVDPRLERLARLLDSEWRVPGTNIRFGLDALLGLVPGVGDSATAIVSGLMIVAAWRAGAPVGTLVYKGKDIAVGASHARFCPGPRSDRPIALAMVP